MRPTRVILPKISVADRKARSFLNDSRVGDQQSSPASCGWMSSLLLSHSIPHWCGIVARGADSEPAAILGGTGARLCRAKQVHGAQWVDAARCDGLCEADAVVSHEPRLVAAISTADCCPVLVACLASGCVAAIHAGWRGLASDVIGATLRGMMLEYGAQPSHMVAAIGPCASGERYEVGMDVIRAFEARGLSSALRVPEGMRSGHAFADCSQAARILLQRAGVPGESVENEAPCTMSDARFPSYRREPSNPARMTSAIACRR